MTDERLEKIRDRAPMLAPEDIYTLLAIADDTLAENAALKARVAEAFSLYDLCWNALNVAVTNEDGLDGKVAETLMKEIREWQAND